MRLSTYIDSIRQTGKMSFSSDEARSALNISLAALNMSLSRLRKKGVLVTFYKSFHIIVPPEYRSFGCLPANQLLPLLMTYLKIPYYVCLLSAAELYGAAHQRSQIYQVMVNRRMNDIHCGKISIHFIFKKDLLNTPTQSFSVATGYLLASTPEATAKDLFLYPRHAGGLNHIATLLTELVDMISPQTLQQIALSSKQHAWIQRLGYVLSEIESDNETLKKMIISVLKKYIQSINPSYIPLVERSIPGFRRDKTWRLIINSSIESDI